MTRGLLSMFILLILINGWLGYNLHNLKIKVMDEKNQSEKLKEIQDRHVQNASETINSLSKENANLKTLLSITQDRNKTLEDQNIRLLKHNAFKLKEIRSMLDTAILNNLEELLEKDRQTNHR